MSILSNFFGGVLNFIYESLSSLGSEPEALSYYALALMIMALIVKIITMPLTLKSTKNAQKGMELQEGAKKIMDKYKNDPENQNRKLMEYYKEHDYNPTAGCLPMIIPLIIIFAMINVIRQPEAYIQAHGIREIATNFLWVPDLAKPDPLIYGLPLIYAISMILYTKLVQSSQPVANEQMQASNKVMMYVMPIMMFFFSRNWASGLVLFWATSNIIEIIVRLILRLTGPKKEA